MRPKPLFLSLWAFGAGLSLLTIVILGFVFVPIAGQASGGGEPMLRAVMVILALASAGALSVATGVAWFVSRRLARPLEQLGAVARAIAQSPRRYVRGLSTTTYREATDLARALDALSAELAREEAQKDAFLAAVAHELRTPLTYVQGYARSLLDGMVTSPEDVHDHLTVIDREARRLGRMVADLLDREALAAGRVSLRLGPVDPAVVAAEAVQDVAPAAREKGIRLDLEVAAGLPVVQADGDRLRQVLWNLLDNALAHTPPGGRVWVEVRQACETVEVTVHDTGSGFDPAESETIWRPFHRLDGTRKERNPTGRRGYGLGLAMVRQIVEAHGGTVHAEGRPGQGASVGFRLPVTVPVDAPGSATVRPAPPGITGSGDAAAQADEPGIAAAPGGNPPAARRQPVPPAARPAGGGSLRSGDSLVALVLVVMGFLALGTASFPPLFESLSRGGGPGDLLIIAATGAVSTVMLAGVIALLYRAWMGGRSA
ncbi:integral membrane sensor signal transduction histidine kinase [Thermaerobacter marianensis DSM 12885]|uniref:histidine kinase n=1 Tax=Thermaerobacter marianensis (strain ATCC 700841 / DSM 12885 / JCM 10246 / 7p75a) TaxID=644966 RepID=E6SH55_THEM7|nr:HAMP domain-containing sensor histidine kinase [Thermaerobacter marianensis]ADU51719.1 integral membrane sensor signal transduction histidine kinase [Thermaerobacter marianensis DSM 12885]